jgi:cytochrome b subunit of formate dehydrogenase
MARPAARTARRSEQEQAGQTYIRFSLSQRIEHFVLLVSFSILGITGLAQKFATSALGEATLGLFGGINGSRIVHRSAAVVLLAVSIYHILALMYRTWVLEHSLSALPTPGDFRHLFQDILFYLGRRKHKAYYGRYSYAEKVEYLAVVWGTVVMAVTGFMMWNPIATTELVPGEFIPAAKAAHGGEALLAVLAIILWHFYHVHIRHFNKSMFTGRMTREEMLHEHPAELALIEAGKGPPRLPPQVIRARQRVFFPLAAITLAVMGYGLFRFITFEETAIATVPRGETAPIFLPFTPTPSPTPCRPPPPFHLARSSPAPGKAGSARCLTAAAAPATCRASSASFPWQRTPLPWKAGCAARRLSRAARKRACWCRCSRREATRASFHRRSYKM